MTYMDNIILIGMPASGKSTVKRLSVPAGEKYICKQIP